MTEIHLYRLDLETAPDKVDADFCWSVNFPDYCDRSSDDKLTLDPFPSANVIGYITSPPNPSCPRWKLRPMPCKRPCGLNWSFVNWD